MRLNVRYLLAALWLLLPGVTSAHAQNAPVQGRIVEVRTGTPIGSVSIVIRRDGANAGGALSAADGSFRIPSVAPGTYQVEASRIGYARAQQELVVASGGSARVEIQLSPTALTSDAVVVTGSRREERVTDAPMSVAVVDGASVVDRQQASVFGALRSVQGIDYFETGLGQQQVSARGFVSPFTSNMLVLVDNRLSSLPGVGATLAGMIPVSQGDIRQVEVVLGPSSSLYGANAGTGVVNILTKDPRENPGQSISITAGERDVFRMGVRSSAMLTPTFGYKLSGERYRAHDWERHNTFRVTNQSGTVLHSATDQPDFDIDTRTLGGSLYLYPTEGTRLVYSGGVSRGDLLNLSNIGRLQARDWELSFHQLRANVQSFYGLGSLFLQGYHTGNSAGRTYNLDLATQLQFPTSVGGQGKTRDQAIAEATFIDRSSRLDLEGQHSIAFGGDHVFTSGLQWRRSKPVSEGTYLDDGPEGQKIEIDETGVYTQYENSMVKNVRLTLGARYDTHTDFDARFSPKASLSYGRSNHNVRVTYNTAYNSPPIQVEYARSYIRQHPSGLHIWLRGAHQGFEFVNVRGGAAPQALGPLQPTEITSWELGYKGTWARRLFVDVSAYQSLYENFITSPQVINDPANGIFVKNPKTGQPMQEITLTYLNYGELPITGTDVGAHVALTDRLMVNATFSYQMPGDFRKARPNVAAPSFNAPTHKYKGGVAFRDYWRSGSSAELAFTRVQGYMFTSALAYNSGMVPTYSLIDMNVGVPLPPMAGTSGARLGLAAKNLLNSRHRETPGSAELGRIVLGTLSVDFR